LTAWSYIHLHPSSHFPLESWVAKVYYRFQTFEPQVVVAQALLSILLAAFTFLALRLLSRFSATEKMLRTIAGAIGVLAGPGVALIFPEAFSFAYEVLIGDYYQWFYRVEQYRGWLCVELLLVSICMLLYYLRQRSVFLPLVLLVLHFSLWSWTTGMHANLIRLARDYGSLKVAFWISASFYWAIPVLGLFSSACWVVYIRRSNGQFAEVPVV